MPPIELALFIHTRSSFFLTSTATPLLLSPKREELGVGSTTDVKFLVRSRAMEGGLGDREVGHFLVESLRVFP